jgi:predicted metalloprotease with PDZ domain
MQKTSFIIIAVLGSLSSVFAQHPLKDAVDAVEVRYAASQPVVGYTLQVDTTDLSYYAIEMRLRNVPDTFRVAMVAHPEYDDRFWRFVEEMHVETKNGQGNVLREDSALWRIIAPGGEAVLHYRIHLPAAPEGQRGAWRPFLSPTGGLAGGPHSFMYVVGSTLVPSHITLKLPKGWMAATGLESTADANTFFAPSVAVLIDAPILIGHFKSWQFFVDQVPHRVAYWPLPNATAFDTTTLVNYIQRFIQQVDALFGRLPYREYSFLLQDGAYGALEHCNSVTIGMPGADLAKDITSYLDEIAHECFHTWNLMRIHPVEYGDVSYKTPPLSRGLWWSEGLTMFYADLLLRRAGLPVYDSSRIKHLEGLIGRYFGSSGNSKLSVEKVSLAAYGPPGMLGDYNASTHLQGELLGTVLDLIIRDATNGKHSIDDVMRKMMERYSGEKGFVNKDIEQAVAEVCKCNVHSFFADHIYGNKPLDLNIYLKLAGLHFNTIWEDAIDPDGKSSTDLRVYAYQLPGQSAVKIGITDPLGCWGRAGLHTGDIIRSVNGIAVTNAMNLRRQLGSVKSGDNVSVEVQKPTGSWKTNVTVTGYKEPVVMIKEITGASPKQKKLLADWLAGKL